MGSPDPHANCWHAVGGRGCWASIVLTFAVAGHQFADIDADGSAIGRLLRHGGDRCCCASLELHKIEIELIPARTMNSYVLLWQVLFLGLSVNKVPLRIGMSHLFIQNGSKIEHFNFEQMDI